MNKLLGSRGSALRRYGCPSEVRPALSVSRKLNATRDIVCHRVIEDDWARGFVTTIPGGHHHST